MFTFSSVFYKVFFFCCSQTPESGQGYFVFMWVCASKTPPSGFRVPPVGAVCMAPFQLTLLVHVLPLTWSPLHAGETSGKFQDAGCLNFGILLFHILIFIKLLKKLKQWKIKPKDRSGPPAPESRGWYSALNSPMFVVFPWRLRVSELLTGEGCGRHREDETSFICSCIKSQELTCVLETSDTPCRRWPIRQYLGSKQGKPEAWQLMHREQAGQWCGQCLGGGGVQGRWGRGGPLWERHLSWSPKGRKDRS